MYPLGGWKSGGVSAATIIVRRQKTRKGLGGDGAEYSLAKGLRVKKELDRRPAELHEHYAFSGPSRLGNLKANYFSFSGPSHVGRLPLRMEDTWPPARWAINADI